MREKGHIETQNQVDTIADLILAGKKPSLQEIMNTWPGTARSVAAQLSSWANGRVLVRQYEQMWDEFTTGRLTDLEGNLIEPLGQLKPLEEADGWPAEL